MIEHASGRGEGRVIEITYTHCLLRAAPCLACNHVHWLFEAAYGERDLLASGRSKRVWLSNVP